MSRYDGFKILIGDPGYLEWEESVKYAVEWQEMMQVGSWRKVKCAL